MFFICHAYISMNTEFNHSALTLPKDKISYQSQLKVFCLGLGKMTYGLSQVYCMQNAFIFRCMALYYLVVGKFCHFINRQLV